MNNEELEISRNTCYLQHHIMFDEIMTTCKPGDMLINSDALRKTEFSRCLNDIMFKRLCQCHTSDTSHARTNYYNTITYYTIRTYINIAVYKI